MTLEERVMFIEGAYYHLDLATKADIHDLRRDLMVEIRASEVRMIKWVAGLMIGTALVTVTAVAVLLRLFL